MAIAKQSIATRITAAMTAAAAMKMTAVAIAAAIAKRVECAYTYKSANISNDENICIHRYTLVCLFDEL